MTNQMKYQIRDFQLTDSQAVNRVALSAFNQYENQYSDWPTFSNKIANMASLAEKGELIVATVGNNVVGAVVYIPPGKPKGFFPPEWPVIRMLVVDPDCRGMGIGKSLTEKCIRHAIRDISPLIALHTSPIMDVALKMYLRMGFIFERETPPIHSVPYNIYTKQL